MLALDTLKYLAPLLLGLLIAYRSSHWTLSTANNAMELNSTPSSTTTPDPTTMSAAAAAPARPFTSRIPAFLRPSGCSQSQSDQPAAIPEPDPATTTADAPFTHIEHMHARKHVLRKLYSWYWPTDAVAAHKAEQAILTTLPFYRPSDADDAAPINSQQPVRARSGFVDSAAPGSAVPALINTLVVERTSDAEQSKATGAKKTPIVLTHGYGAGLAMWYRNLPALATALVAQRGHTLYAIDWLGMARSARVPLPPLNSKDDQATIDSTEAYFIESLERWRARVGADKMILVGHSLGGYLSAVYALKYPERVEKLVLVSPVGVPDEPDAVAAAATAAAAVNRVEGAAGGDQADSETTNFAAAAMSDTSPIASASSSSDSAAPPAPADPAVPAPPSGRRPPVLPPHLAVLRSTFGFLWNNGFTPFSLVRFAGPFGPHLTNFYTTRRFAHLSPEEIDRLREYIFHVNTGDTPAGEFALNALLKFRAYAKSPLKYRLAPLFGRVPVRFVYGDVDWMDSKHAVEVVKEVAPHMETDRVVRVVAGAGHQVFMDNPQAFDEELIRIVDEQGI
ncbi:hypothetical protein GGF31_000785 [Allomyces arbusculus]|nr:hypothetical protein GGF31_000785 [Allomyces arbusculus]